MSYLSYNGESMVEVADDGTITRPMPIPFEQWSLLGGWKPACIKHKLLFQRRQSYYDHYTSLCNDYPASDCPPSDLAVRLKGYKRVWL